jgi:hypothetical protein
MDDVIYQKLQQYHQALKALQRSVASSIQEGTYEGTGRMAVKSYQGIQRKVAELYPEDFYIADTLALETVEDAKEKHMMGQVQLASSQMIIYLDGLMREYRNSTGASPADFNDLKAWGRDFGRDFQDQIIRMTKTTLRRALENVDVDVQGPDSMAGANMENAQLENVNFSGRNLKGAVMINANLKNANFSGANLHGAVMEGTDATGANFSGANLKDAVLINANLTNANLTGANLKNAVLEGANMTGAKIAGANFKDAVLQGATLPHGEEFHHEAELMQYGAAARPSSTGNRHVHIEITHDEDEDKPKHHPHEPYEDDPEGPREV